MNEKKIRPSSAPFSYARFPNVPGTKQSTMPSPPKKNSKTLLLQVCFVSIALLLADAAGFRGVLLDQVDGITNSFATTNFPRDGACKHWWSGYTGMLYAVPVLLSYEGSYEMR